MLTANNGQKRPLTAMRPQNLLSQTVVFFRSKSRSTLKTPGGFNRKSSKPQSKPIKTIEFSTGIDKKWPGFVDRLKWSKPTDSKMGVATGLQPQSRVWTPAYGFDLKTVDQNLVVQPSPRSQDSKGKKAQGGLGQGFGRSWSVFGWF